MLDENNGIGLVVETRLNGQNGRAKLKSYGYPRIKLKNILWSGDLKDSLRIAAENSIHEMSSNPQTDS